MEEKALNNDAQSVDNSEKEKKKNKTRKVIATTTYFIAMLCLLAGLFAPLFRFDKSNLPASMMFRYLPSMLNGIVGKEILPSEKLGSWFLEYPFIGRFDFIALISLLYAVVTVISVVMFIPILLGSKKKNTSARCALGVEVLAMLVTLTYIAYKTYTMTGELEWHDFNFLLAFGGSLLMAIIQTVSSKGSIGVSKVIALLLSVIGVMALLDITMFIPKLAEPLAKLAGKIKAGEVATFLAQGESGLLGIVGITMLTDIKGTVLSFAALAQGGKEGIISIVILLLLMLIAIFVVVNLVCDVIGLSTGKKYKKDGSPCRNGASNSFALTRYILTIIFVAALIVMTFVIKGLNMRTGLYLYLLAAVLLISLINAAARTAVDNARYKKAKSVPAEEAPQKEVQREPAPAERSLPVAETVAEPVAEQAPAYESLPVYAEPVEEAPAVEPAEERYEPLPVYSEPVVEETPAVEPLPVYEPAEEEPEEVEPAPVAEPLSAPLDEPEEITRTVYIYGGATDEFMETLTDQEKVEFVELFIKKSKGTVNGVPDYTIDGDNSDFFPAVFVHINRFRNIVSDALMTKMYKQLGKSM